MKHEATVVQAGPKVLPDRLWIDQQNVREMTSKSSELLWNYFDWLQNFPKLAQNLPPIIENCQRFNKHQPQHVVDKCQSDRLLYGNRCWGGFPYFRLINIRWFPSLKMEKFEGFTKLPFHAFWWIWNSYPSFWKCFWWKIYHFRSSSSQIYITTRYSFSKTNTQNYDETRNRGVCTLQKKKTNTFEFPDSQIWK